MLPALFESITKVKYSELSLMLLLGVISFACTTWVQMIGVHHTQAAEVSLIVSIEPLVSILLAWIFLKEKISKKQLVSYFGATLGFILLTWHTSSSPASLSSGTIPNQMPESFVSHGLHWMGNSLILISLLGEAMFSVFGKKLTSKYTPESLFGILLAISVAFLTLTLGSTSPSAWINHLSAASLKSWVALFWIGPIGTAMGYYLWLKILTQVSVGPMVITLLIQPLMGSIWGVMLQEESLASHQMLGGIMMIASMFSVNIARSKPQVDKPVHYS